MVNWNGVDADVNLWLNKHFTAGRSGRSINKIIIHHNAGRLSIEQIYQVWQSRQASAHYQVDVNGRIGQLVHDADTAWHAGDWETNLRSIGIEHANSGGAAQGWPISEATRENGAHLVAALCKRYGLGRPEWGKNVFPHQHFQSTACPGKLYGEYKDSYIKRAQEWYDSMTGSTPTPAPSPTPAKSVTKTDHQLMLDIDGYPGAKTYSRFQQVMGTPIDGVKSKPSEMIRAFQRFLNSVVSTNDIRNLTGKPQLDVDGYDGWRTWKVFQYVAWNWAASYVKTLSTGKSFGTFVDGVAGPETIKALQWMLNNSYANSGKLMKK